MDGWVWSNGWMIVTGENWSTGRKSLYKVSGSWMDEYGAMVEWFWQGKTEVLWEKHYTVWVVDGWMSMEQWLNDTDRGKLKYWEKNASRCHLCRHKSASCCTDHLPLSNFQALLPLQSRNPPSCHAVRPVASTLADATRHHVGCTHAWRSVSVRTGPGASAALASCGAGVLCR